MSCHADSEASWWIQSRPVSGISWWKVQKTENNGPFFGQTPGKWTLYLALPWHNIKSLTYCCLAGRYLFVGHFENTETREGLMHKRVCGAGYWVMQHVRCSQPCAATVTGLWSSSASSLACWTLHGSYKCVACTGSIKHLPERWNNRKLKKKSLKSCSI